MPSNKVWIQGWSDKSIYYTSRGPKFGSQHLPQASQNCCNSNSRGSGSPHKYLHSYVWLYRHEMCTYTHRHTWFKIQLIFERSTVPQDNILALRRLGWEGCYELETSQIYIVSWDHSGVPSDFLSKRRKRGRRRGRGRRRKRRKRRRRKRWRRKRRREEEKEEKEEEEEEEEQQEEKERRRKQTLPKMTSE